MSFGELVEILGPAAEKLLLARGGRSLYIPSRAGEHSPLVAILGQADADRVAARHGGQSVNIPILQAKRIRILHLRRDLRWSIPRIAAAMNCTTRTVYAVLAANPEDGLPADETAAARRQLALPFGV